METPSLTDAVRRELLAHPGVTEAAHRFGGVVFHLRGHELGHLHGERLADLPLPAHLREELVASGRVTPDHVAPDSAWVSRSVEGPEDVAEVVELFRMSYEHAAAQPAQAGHQEEGQEAAPSVDAREKASWRDRLALPSLPRRRRRR